VAPGLLYEELTADDRSCIRRHQTRPRRSLFLPTSMLAHDYRQVFGLTGIRLRLRLLLFQPPLPIPTGRRFPAINASA
jgi:hypothetical protein